MRSCFLVFVLILGFGCAKNNKVSEGTLSPKMQSIGDSLNTYFSKLTEMEKFNGVVLAYKNDTLLLQRAYNLDNDVKSSAYVTDSTQFDIHSISKLMTLYLVVKLENEGKLSRNQTLDAFYDDFPRGDQITLNMLLEHSSGLPRELMGLEGEEYEFTSDQIVELAKKQEVIFEPGTDVQYSNVGYEILYNIVSKVHGKPFAQCVLEEVFEPMGMEASGAHFFTDENRVRNLARNHILKDSLLTQVDNIQRDEFRTARLYSTVEDLKKFLDQVSREPFKSALVDENGVIAKDGGSKGARAQVYSDLEHHFQFVLLSNYDEMPFFQTIADVAKILRSEPVEFPKEIDRKSMALDVEILKHYEGSYAFADFDGMVLEIRVEGNQLAIYQENQKIGKLKAESPTVFFENPKASESFEFIKNDSGTYNALMGWKGIAVEGKRISN
ncbi:serine hydrolase domain-containing protein [Flagellimonas crocea]|uniref:serine hydrolase domain-containing protein n=1 Tax=Flagellimonas crocea TaxID=3067311 RepID=UPI00296E89B7|nr:serine hydrolase domain-containing protein [Muricauda sp. DH64]